MSATTKTTKAVNSFLAVLKRSNKQIRDDRATRIAKSTAMSYDAAVNAKTKEIFELEDKLETQLDLSADNRTTSINSVRAIANFDSDNFIQTRSDNLFALEIAKQELAILKEDASFYKV